MPITPDPAAAPGLPEPDSRDDLGELISEMEIRVGALIGWAFLIRDLGTCSDAIEPDGLFAAGRAMLENAYAIEADWKRCFELSRHLRKSAP